MFSALSDWSQTASVCFRRRAKAKEHGRLPSGPRNGRVGSSLLRFQLSAKRFVRLQSLWIDWLVLRLLNEPTEAQKRVWFVIDELASLQKLPQLHTAITEARKSRNPVVLGFQGKAQLEYLYGHLAEVMLSQPATSVWLTTKEPNAGEWVSKFIGKVEVERLRETHFDGTRAGRNFSLDRQVEPLVLESEISGLADLHAYMKYQNYVTRFSFPYFDMPEVAKGFELRERPDDKLPYDLRKLRGTEASHAELKQEPEPPSQRSPMNLRRRRDRGRPSDRRPMSTSSRTSLCEVKTLPC